MRYNGLTDAEVAQRTAEGLVNGDAAPPTKSVAAIFRSNVCTFFNFLNIVLAGLVIATGSVKNTLFMGIVVANALIGTVQELRAKRVIDKLSLISAPKARVLRSGEQREIPVGEIVMDDLLLLSPGGQITSDAVVTDGSCEVNESLLTGESEPVYKSEGDHLMSGSFVVSGHCSARVEHVGAENYSAKITGGAKFIKQPSSELMRSINRIIKIVSLFIIPLGALLFLRQYFLGGSDISSAVVSSVAAMIGMIPEGLVLLTSVVLAVSVVRLSRRKTLVQELYCIETLARVDVLCLDKTGTITEGRMRMTDFLPLGGTPEQSAREYASAFAAFSGDTNPTIEAVRAACAHSGSKNWEADGAVPFSSARKWSGVSFRGRDSIVFGAPSILAPSLAARERERLDRYASEGGRVLLLAVFPGKFEGFAKPDESELRPAAFLVLGDKVRDDARETLEFFEREGVALRVISGDDPATVANVARSAGLRGAENYVDAAALSDEELPAAAEKYTVFGRVSPEQKKKLVAALRAAGHTVAMTGDGVNDVPALRESDCSIAMAAGSDAARNVSQLVLLDSSFSSLPLVVAEGRRSINNIQRSASLFLIKTTYAVLLAFAFLFISSPYPFQPIQLTLISALTIGAPSFLLALEPNLDRVSGHFIENVLVKALPGGLAIVANVLLATLFASVAGLTPAETSSLTVLVTGTTALVALFRVCMPFNALRRAMWIVLAAAFYCAAFLFREFFSIAEPDALVLGAVAAFALLAVILFAGTSKAVKYVYSRVRKRRNSR